MTALVALAVVFAAQQAVAHVLADDTRVARAASSPPCKTGLVLNVSSKSSDPSSVMDALEMPHNALSTHGRDGAWCEHLASLLVPAALMLAAFASSRQPGRGMTLPWVRLGVAVAGAVLMPAVGAKEAAVATSQGSPEAPIGVLFTISLDMVLPALCVVVLLLILRKLSHIHTVHSDMHAMLKDAIATGKVVPGAPALAHTAGEAHPCPEAMLRGTEPSGHWAEVAGRWVVDRTEGDVDGVLGLVGYGPWARGAFKLGQYGRGVAELDIIMHDGRSCTLTFGGGPMPKTTNTMRVDGTVQTFVGNEGIPGDDEYMVAMWWEGDAMVAWGEHKSGRFPRMDTRRYLRDGLDGARYGELVVERTVDGVFSRMIYTRRR